ncbi:bax inhibitor 1-like [Babylonia areolata]|uniref:bax inhibitor 1-like n=1 Tax=Babylonia areolata TaxID=304850 RepID=UPI003FD58984
MATRNASSPSWSTVFKFDNLERPVQQHLKNVYACLGTGMLAAAAGGYLTLIGSIMQAGFLTALISVGLMLWLNSTRHCKENFNMRMGIFLGFTFCSGVSLGPCLRMAIYVDPSIIPTALLATSVIFISFTIAALFNTNRTFLYMGGLLMSTLSWLMVLSLANLFFGSRLLFNVSMYLGLFVFCAFVLYDTQLIVEKRRLGDDDYIWHSVDLFLDFINIFRKLMIILSNKETEKKRKD